MCTPVVVVEDHVVCGAVAIDAAAVGGPLDDRVLPEGAGHPEEVDRLVELVGHFEETFGRIAATGESVGDIGVGDINIRLHALNDRVPELSPQSSCTPEQSV